MEFEKEIIKFDEMEEKRMLKFLKVINSINVNTLNNIRKEIDIIYSNYSKNGVLDIVEINKFNRMDKFKTYISEQINESYKNFNSQQREFMKNLFFENYYYFLYLISYNSDTLVVPDKLKNDNFKSNYENDQTGVSTKERIDKNKLITNDRIISSVVGGMIAGLGVNAVKNRLKTSIEQDYNIKKRMFETKENEIRNKSRENAFIKASSKVDLLKVWVATLDTRTRRSHRDLDGTTLKINQKFKGKFGEGLSPSRMNDPRENINCRCRLAYVYDKKSLEDSQRIERNPDTRRNTIGKYQTYEQYKKYYKL